MLKKITLLFICCYSFSAYATTCPLAQEFLIQTAQGWDVNATYKAQGWSILWNTNPNPHAESYKLAYASITGDKKPPLWSASCDYYAQEYDSGMTLINNNYFKLDTNKLKGFEKIASDLYSCKFSPGRNSAECIWQ